MTRVAVIGAGASGLTSIKSCLEEGLQPVCYERTSHLGGLWYYSDNESRSDPHGPAAIYHGLHTNVPKEMMAFSDFPMSKLLPPFPKARDIYKYYEQYADHFGLLKHIEFNVEVVSIDQANDYDETGRWKVTVRPISGEIRSEVFDAVMMCSGLYPAGYMPHYPGLDSFKGEVMHSCQFKRGSYFTDKTVLLGQGLLLETLPILSVIMQARSTCASCHCGREDHDIIHDNLVTVYERLNLPIEDHAQLQRTKEKALALGYSWVPQGLSVTKIEEFMNSLPNNQIPRLHTAGEKYRDRQLILQIPKQDVSDEFCHFLGDAATNESYTQFLELRDETAFGVGKVKDHLPQDMECFKCGGEIEAGEIGIFVDKMEDEACCWHPFCFTCNTCEELLVDTGYFFRDGQIHCERHYAELIMPRCASCDELIFTGEYVRAMNENFHSGHFCCQQCDKALSGQSYILKEEKPFCVACYDDNFANECAECNQKIGHDCKDLIFKSKHYHETCFEARYTCSMCKASLADKAFGNWDGQLCCLQCYEKNLAKNCQACGELIKPGMKRLGFQGKEWHDKCFRCKVCDKHIGGGSFVPKEDNIYCSTCYEETFGTKCAGCGKIISSGGLQYKNEPWHRECFGCAECGKSLYNTRFTVRDDKRLCADCFGERYARKCSECKQPIVGQGGTKYVCFEQRNWHNKCFNCKRCQVSLVNECFVTEGEDIICPNCAQG